jgi:oxygen-dependent protoporphyrinogen oxidase
MTTQNKSHAIAVIGAGITGLTAAHRLEQAGFDVVLFEASERPGGQISSSRKDDFLIDGGPHTLLARGRVPGFINGLGLKERVVEADPKAKKRFIVRYAEPHPLPTDPMSFLRTPILSPLAKLRLVAEPFISAENVSEMNREDESLANFIRRRLGPEALEFLVDPMVAGTFAGDATRLSASRAFPKLHALAQEHGSLLGGALSRAFEKLRHRKNAAPAEPRPKLISFDEGAQVLTDALAATLQDRIELRTEVFALERKSNRRWLVRYKQTSPSGSTRRRQKTVDALICTIPAHALANIEVAQASNASNNDAVFAPLRGIKYAPVSVVSLGFRRSDVRHPLDGFGMLIPREEDRNILGTLFMSTLFGNRAPAGQVLLTSFVGGARDPELAGLNSEELFAKTLADLDALLGLNGEPTMRAHAFWPQAIPQYEVGYAEFEKSFERIEADNPGLFLGGSYRDGIALPDRIDAGYELVARMSHYLSAQ